MGLSNSHTVGIVKSQLSRLKQVWSAYETQHSTQPRKLLVRVSLYPNISIIKNQFLNQIFLHYSFIVRVGNRIWDRNKSINFKSKAIIFAIKCHIFKREGMKMSSKLGQGDSN